MLNELYLPYISMSHKKEGMWHGGRRDDTHSDDDLSKRMMMTVITRH